MNILEANHEDMVSALKKPGVAILLDTDGFKLDLVHMAMGISGEAGELLDAIKKHAVYGKPLDRENVLEELGDLEFYMAGMRQILHMSRNDVLKYNVDKLSKRYPQGTYTDADANTRADKIPEHHKAPGEPELGDNN